MYEISMEKNDTVALQCRVLLMEAGHTKIHIDIGTSTKILCSTALNTDMPVPESSYRKLSRKNVHVVTF